MFLRYAECVDQVAGNLALVASVGALAGKEGLLLRKLLPLSLLGLAALSLVVCLQAG